MPTLDDVDLSTLIGRVLRLPYWKIDNTGAQLPETLYEQRQLLADNGWDGHFQLLTLQVGAGRGCWWLGPNDEFFIVEDSDANPDPDPR